jgi:hypothetical protein
MIPRINSYMDRADQLIAIALVGFVLTIAPLYCTASTALERRPVVDRVVVREVQMPPLPAHLLSPHAPKLKRIAYLPPVKPRSR